MCLAFTPSSSVPTWQRWAQGRRRFHPFLTELGAQPPGACVLYVQLDDVEQTHRELTASGIAFWGYGAELTDPDGNSVRLWDARTMREKCQR
jgi:hypothetical protein